MTQTTLTRLVGPALRGSPLAVRHCVNQRGIRGMTRGDTAPEAAVPAAAGTALMVISAFTDLVTSTSRVAAGLPAVLDSPGAFTTVIWQEGHRAFATDLALLQEIQ
jgi:hypothetical protein